MQNHVAHMLEEDFVVSDRATTLPLPEHPALLGYLLVAACETGSAELTVRDAHCRIAAGDLLVLFPQQSAAIGAVSADFAATYFVVPQTLFHDVVSMMHRFTPRFFLFMLDNYRFRLSERDRGDIEPFFRRLSERAAVAEESLRRELVVFSLAVFCMDLYRYYKECDAEEPVQTNRRKEELAYEFFRPVAEEYVAHKDVSFYADRMNITPTYLTIVVKETTGMSAKEWMADFVTRQIKTRLRNPALNMQEIAFELNFPTQTSMNRFFRNYTGMSLTQYRRSITP